MKTNLNKTTIKKIHIYFRQFHFFPFCQLFTWWSIFFCFFFFVGYISVHRSVELLVKCAFGIFLSFILWFIGLFVVAYEMFWFVLATLVANVQIKTNWRHMAKQQFIYFHKKLPLSFFANKNSVIGKRKLNLSSDMFSVFIVLFILPPKFTFQWFYLL